MLSRDPTQANAFVSEKDRSAGEQELPELQNRIEPPSLEKQDSAAEKTDGRKENVVVACQRWLEAAHEIQHCATNGQHDSNNAGPVETGVNHVESPGKQLSDLIETRSDASSLRTALVRSELAVDAVGLTQEKQADGGRDNHDHGTPDQAAEEIGKGGGHSERAGADEQDGNP